jgi:hypothetical protein
MRRPPFRTTGPFNDLRLTNRGRARAIAALIAKVTLSIEPTALRGEMSVFLMRR